MDITKIKFGRIESPFDERDYNLKEFVPSGVLRISPITSRNWAYNAEPLNQKETGHCVGFSMANFGINDPLYTKYTEEDGHAFYYKCKEVDGHPKEENGSYVRSAAKVLRRTGKINTYAFATDISTIKWWLLNRGPIIVGTIWTEGMCTPDKEYKINTSGAIIGGHAYLLNEWTKDGYIGIQNSWGKDWGRNGKAYLHSTSFEKIFAKGGEAMTAVEVEKPSFFSRFFW